MKPTCICGCREDQHCTEHVCHGCGACVRYRPVVVDPNEQFERLCAEAIAMMRMPTMERVQ